MTHLVTDACVNCKYTDCAEVCPVNCFYEGNNMLVIKAEECIDCALCVNECPVKAISADLDLAVADRAKWLEVNKDYSEKWSKRRVSSRKAPLPDADKYKDETGKFEKYFDPS